MKSNKLPFIITTGFVPFEASPYHMEIVSDEKIVAIKDSLENHDKYILLIPQISKKVPKKYSEISNFAMFSKIDKAEFVESKEHNKKIYKVDISTITKVGILKPHDLESKIASTVIDSYPVDEYWINEDIELLKELTEKVNLDSKLKKNYGELINNANQALKEKLYKICLAYLAQILLPDDPNSFDIDLEYFELNDNSSKLTFLSGKFFNLNYSDSVSSQVESDVNSKLSKQMAKQQQEFYLREKLRIIKEELGELSNRTDDVERLKKYVKNNPYPKNIKEKILSEIQKYEVAFSSNEYTMIKSYVDWLIELPWWQMSVDRTDLNEVESILNKNHYGIEKIKQRIIEHIAVTINSPNAKAPIICLVGPPGVGKTSLAKSIAEALDKKFIKVSLGGVKDESEIRGHRRTYLGSMPGRIIKGMKKAKVLNPLFLLDEIDKMSSDYKGDPSSALLEVLDPEQNKMFSDNYIEEDYDLSKVMFICTANYYDQIPEALIDRMEVIELSSYTFKEKLSIAKQHLVKRVLTNLNLTNKDIKFTDEAIEYIISYYTREAGVRELERLISQIVRKVLVLKLQKKPYESTIGVKEVLLHLGKIKYDLTIKDQTSIPGVVNGMAYTQAGGDLLPIEAKFFPGKGDIVITGNLEKTMNESVSVAYGFVKSNVKEFGLEDVDFSKIDLHLHVPAGGIPKDGPSAGVTITTAILSALKQVPVSVNLAMTGEIMLRGKVGIIGGVKEKIISAHRAGVRTFFIPKDDERFLEDIPKEILKEIKVNLVTNYNEIYNSIFK